MSETTSPSLGVPLQVKAGADPAAAALRLSSQPPSVDGPPARSNDRRSIRRRLRLLPMLVTLVVAASERELPG